MGTGSRYYLIAVVAVQHAGRVNSRPTVRRSSIFVMFGYETFCRTG